MTPLDIQDHRVQRLQELLNKKFDGKKVELGRALGHKTGAFVRQLLDRERPITEKTASAIEALPGCAGWFALPMGRVIETRMGGFDTGAPGAPIVISKPIGVGHLLQAISRATRAVPDERRKAIQSLASAPDLTDADAEVIDTLAGGAVVNVAPAAAPEVDRAFREAFYRVTDQMKTAMGAKLMSDLREGIEEEVAKSLGLDIDQARRALNARQLHQG